MSAESGTLPLNPTNVGPLDGSNEAQAQFQYQDGRKFDKIA